MSVPRIRVPGALTLAAGVFIGWGLAATRLPVLRASGGDRSGQSILTSGPAMLGYNAGLKVQMSQDALYFLDYSGGRLWATIPSHQSGVGGNRIVGAFAERDLIADFKINMDEKQPRFLMTTGSLGVYSEGWAPLYVFETTTSQVAVYRVQPQMIGAESKPRFELLEMRPLAPHNAVAGAR